MYGSKKSLLGVLVLLSVFQASAWAQISERPVVDKQYDDYLYYDADGTKNISIQGTEVGKTQNYYFNQGATIDSSNGDIHAVFLAHNWSDGYNPDTKVIINVGENKDLHILNYKGYSLLQANDGALLQVNGGNLILESGARSTNTDNTSAVIYTEDKGNIRIDADSVYIGNLRDDRYNVGAISNAGGGVIDINVKNDFVAENVDFGLTIQPVDGGEGSAAVAAGGSITINAQTDSEVKGYKGAGIYAMAYYNADDLVNVAMQAGEDLYITAAGYGVYTYGNVKTNLEAGGDMLITSSEKYGLYFASKTFEEQLNANSLKAGNNLTISGKNYGIYSTGNVKTSLESGGDMLINSNESRGIYVTSGSVDNVSNETVLHSGGNLTVMGKEYGVSASAADITATAANEMRLAAQDGWSVCLLNGSQAALTAAAFYAQEDVYVKDSALNLQANTMQIAGQVRALDGGTVNFTDADGGNTGSVIIAETETDAVTAASDTDTAAVINLKQAVVINSQGDNEYHADKSGERTNSAIRAMRNSEINIDKAQGIYGDIIAGRGEESDAVGGKITINSASGAEFKGDVLAGNDGKIDFTLNGGSVFEGRVDDYADADLGGDVVFRPGEFDIDVTESGGVDLTLNDSTWIARNRSFVSSLKLNNGLVDMTQEEISSVTVGDLSGSGTFKMRLDAQNRENGDMLYVTGSHTGAQNIEVDWINGSSVADIEEGERIRFATTKDGGEALRAATSDSGVFNVIYKTATDAYDADAETEENIDYNGSGDGEGVDKPGNAFVDEVFDGSGTNHYIVGVAAKDESDAGKTIINMSRINYSNAIYMDRLNKRLGEARYIDGDEGMWVRLRHDRIGKDKAFRSMNTMYEIGYDKKQENDGGERRLGFAFDYMRGSAEYTGVWGGGDVKRVGLWAYDTWLGDKGHYADYVAKWGHLSNDFDITAKSTGEKISGDYANNVFSVSAEYGRKKDIGHNWYVEPQTQIQYAHVTSADYKTSQGTAVELDGIDSLIARAGLRLGKDYGVEKRGTIYLKFDVLHEFLGEQDIYAKDGTGVLSRTYSNQGTWYDAGFGFAAQMDEDSYWYMDFEKSFGNDNEDTYQINAGVQWTF